VSAAAELIARAQDAGVRLWTVGELVLFAPRLAMPSDVLEQMRQRRVEVRDVLFDPARRPPPAEWVWPEGSVPLEQAFGAVEAGQRRETVARRPGVVRSKAHWDSTGHAQLEGDAAHG